MNKIDKTPFWNDKSFEKLKGQIELMNEGEEAKTYKVVPITSYHQLIQFVGYAKFLNRKCGNVYFRGQSSLYEGNLIPSLFRPQKDGKTDQLRNLSVENRLKDSHTCIRKKIEPQSDNQEQNKQQKASSNIDIDIENDTPKDLRVVTPLLQHYGIKTEWIDIVDNIWVALWFGFHHFSSERIGNHEHIYISKADNENTDSEYVYILLILSDATNEKKDIRGLYMGEETTLIDLRKALPSSYLRPHCQHGLVFKRKNITASADIDLSEYVVGAAKIQRHLVRQWLHGGDLLSVQSLFPSMNFDNGYKHLFKKFDTYDWDIRTYGSIQLISY